MDSAAIPRNQVWLMAATLIAALAVDVRTDIVGQTVVSAGVWLVLLGILNGFEPRMRFSLMACLVIATMGEVFLSLVWGLYTYRLGNIPGFVPPGHVLLFLIGLTLCSRLSDAAACVVIAVAGIYALVAAAASADTLAVPMFAVLAAAAVLMPAQRRLYATTFLLSLALELYGTWLGNWTWTRQVPAVGLVTTNPPGVAGALYCALDALVAAVTIVALPRLRAARLPGATAEARCLDIDSGVSVSEIRN
jgi:hypothetical protein